MPDLSQAIFPLARTGPAGAQPLGTAFAVGPNLIATCLHVTGGDDRNLIVIAPRINSLTDYQDTTDLFIQHAPVKIVAVDPIHDLCIIEVPVDGGWEFSYSISSPDTVSLGDSVATLSFPHASFGRLVLTRQDTTVGARILTGSIGLKTKQIVLNIQATPGQSGGPVFSIKSGDIIAVLAGSYAPGGGGAISLGGVDPATLHTTTHAVSAEYLKKMIP